MDMIAQTQIPTGQVPGSSFTTSIETNSASAAIDNTQHSSSELSDRQLDRVLFSSPIKKKYRTAGRNESAAGHAGHDTNQNGVTRDSPTQRSTTAETTPVEAASENIEMESLFPLSQAVQTPLPDDDNMDSYPQATTTLTDITTDLESRYKENSSQGGGSAS
jgi:hypothetical protein